MTESTESEILRLREAFVSLSLDAEPRESCPEPGRLWEAVRGELSSSAIRDVIDHTVGCGACAEAWRLARQIEPEQNTVTTRTELPAARPWRWAPAWAPAAVAAMLLVAVGVWWQTGPVEAPPPAYRAVDPTEILRPLTESPVPRQDAVLRWQGPEGASYRVRVTTDDFTTLAEAEDLTAGEYRIPAEALEGLSPGAKIHWWVEASLADGRTESKTFDSVLE